MGFFQNVGNAIKDAVEDAVEEVKDVVEDVAENFNDVIKGDKSLIAGLGEHSAIIGGAVYGTLLNGPALIFVPKNKDFGEVAILQDGKNELSADAVYLASLEMDRGRNRLAKRDNEIVAVMSDGTEHTAYLDGNTGTMQVDVDGDGDLDTINFDIKNKEMPYEIIYNAPVA